MPTAKKLPSGNWRCQVYMGKGADGKAVYKSVTASTKKEAEYEALQLQLHHKAITQSSANMTLREAMNAYIDGREGVISVTTLRGYRTIVANSFPRIMGTQLRKLTPALIQQAVSEEAADHSPKSVHNAYSLMLSALKLYHKPLARELQDDGVKLPQKRKYQPKVLNTDQVTTLVLAIFGNVMEIPILLALWCCLRESEICGLKWTDIDWEQGRLHIHEARVLTGTKKATTKDPKTVESDRWLNLDPYLLERLKQVRETSESEYVTPLVASSILRRFKTILRHNDLPDVRFHDLRHANASIMAMTGVPQYLAQRRGGWSTPDTMNRIYTHTMEAGGSEADEKVNAFFRKILDISHETSHEPKID
jgi:integrase